MLKNTLNFGLIFAATAYKDLFKAAVIESWFL